LVHGSTLDSQLAYPGVVTDRNRLRPANRGHPIQDTTGKARLDVPAMAITSAKAIAMMDL